MQVSLEYPTYYLLFCLALGVGYALLLYFRDRRFPEKSRWVNYALGALRALAVTIIAVLLLEPLLRSITTETQKPIGVVAQDASESITAALDEEERAALQTQLETLTDQLGEQYDVQTYHFGDELREGFDFEFSDKVTNLSSLLSDLYDRYSHQNLGAVVLATDGIFNQGSNPVYSSAKLGAPIYSVLLGDTVPRRDVLLRRVFHNNIAYLGDRFSIQVDVQAQNATGATTNLTVRRITANGAGPVLQTIPIRIDANDFFTTEELTLEADRAGVQRYRISASGVANEAITVNNSRDIFVDVLDARQKILLLAESAHPDISAFRQSLGSNKNYEVDIAYANAPNLSTADYDFVVLHQLPSQKHPIRAVLTQLNQQNTPRLFVVGEQTDLSALNQAQPLLSIRAGSATAGANNVQGTLADNFNLFTLDERIANELPNFPPLLAPFGDFTNAGNGAVLLRQRIGKVDTDYPLLVLGESNAQKTGVLAGEGFWKWRLFDFLQHQNHELTDELFGKMVTYLSLKEDKRRFRVTTAKRIFNENEPIFLNAELYNANYELINDPDAEVTLRGPGGEEYNYVFSRTGNAYQLDAGVLPVGDYTFRARTTAAGETLTFDGRLSVQPVQLELYQTTADHNLLRLLGEEFGGRGFLPGAVPELSATLLARDLKPVRYDTLRTRSVLNLRWLFFVLLALLSLEWFGRRWFGAY